MARPKKTIVEDPPMDDMEHTSDISAVQGDSKVAPVISEDHTVSEKEDSSESFIPSRSDAVSKDAQKYIENATRIRISQLIADTQSEIERCNDYIFANADSDRRFTTYRNELYEYRYKLRQLVFDPHFPHMDAMKLPDLPERIPDQ